MGQVGFSGNFSVSHARLDITRFDHDPYRALHDLFRMPSPTYADGYRAGFQDGTRFGAMLGPAPFMQMFQQMMFEMMFQSTFAGMFPELFGGRSPGAPTFPNRPFLPQVEDINNGQWLVNHGEYKKHGENFEITKGKWAGHWAYKGDDGSYMIVNAETRYTVARYTPPNDAHKIASPLSLDADGDGEFTSRNMTRFDIDGDGVQDTIHDADDGDLVLAFNKDKELGDTTIGADGSELLGDNTDLNNDGVRDGFKDGFEALEAMGRKHGLISDHDLVLSAQDLRDLERLEGLRARQGGLNGTDLTFAQAGITSINLGDRSTTRTERDFDGQGNALTRRNGAGFTTANGGGGEMADIWFELKS